ncbi:MAG: hypothetical protein PVH03_12590 [Chloroflexota bacterium]|jgi:hypothetical protein
MKDSWFALVIPFVALLFGCQPETTVTETPIVPTIANFPPQADSTALITLVRNPGFYEGSYLQLSGQYRPIPLVVCSEEGHFSPATWALVDGGIEILAAGFDGVLRRLAEPGLPLTVEGRWQQWEGPVGCGRRAPVTEIWYFEVNNIVSPNPLTTGQVGDDIASLPIEPSPDTAGEPTPSIVVPTSSPTSPPTSTPLPTTAATSVPQIATTNTPATTPVTTTVTPSPTPISQRGVATSTPTSTATTTGTPATATPDASPTDDDVTSEPIEFEDIFKETLATGEIDRWSFQGNSGDVVYISVSPVQGLDVSLELLDPNDSSLVSRNQGASGQVENINQQSLNTSGEYEILVRSMANSSGDYAIVLQTEDSQPFASFQGNINYGNSRTNSVAENVDEMWNFVGTTGDIVTIRAVASGSEDLVLYIIDPDSLYVEEADDNTTYGPPDDEEIIDEFTLQKTGLYTIGIGEYDYEPFGYTLTLEEE